jgi:hypothetical protein
MKISSGRPHLQVRHAPGLHIARGADDREAVLGAGGKLTAQYDDRFVAGWVTDFDQAPVDGCGCMGRSLQDSAACGSRGVSDSADAC